MLTEIFRDFLNTFICRGITAEYSILISSKVPTNALFTNHPTFLRHIVGRNDRDKNKPNKNNFIGKLRKGQLFISLSLSRFILYESKIHIFNMNLSVRNSR